MSVSAIFKTPDSIADADYRISLLNQDIAAIGTQLQRPKIEDTDPDWRRKATHALLIKKDEKSFLSRWIMNEKSKSGKHSHESALLGSKQIIDLQMHFKLHAKLMGRFGNLLALADRNVKERSEESFEALSAYVDDLYKFLDAN